ncbi:hypothetical protein CEQ90_13715 [Lewinellaceae bacterium SD302]|nr:hypothetical protein CEQ90_13715 [Lewinellaceae bacterium SD302]
MAMKAYMTYTPANLPIGLTLQLMAALGFLDTLARLPFSWSEFIHSSFFLQPESWALLNPLVCFASIALAGFATLFNTRYATLSLTFMLFFCAEELLSALAGLSTVAFSPLGIILIMLANGIGFFLLVNGPIAAPSRRGWLQLIGGTVFSLALAVLF